MKNQRSKRKIPNTKYQKGITLIALIITIIVLLILAVVAIGAIQNDGIISHAKNSRDKYTVAQEKEQITLGRSEYLVDKNISDNAQLKVNGAEVIGAEETAWRITFKKTNNSYILDKQGNITLEQEKTLFDWSTVGLNVDTDTEYIIADLDMVSIFLKSGNLIVKNITTNQEIMTIDAKKAENINAAGNLTYEDSILSITMNSNNKDIDIEIEGMGTLTAIKEEYDNQTVYSNKKVLEKLEIVNYTGSYTGTWTVIGEANGKVKLVSTRDITDYTLGYEDPRAIQAVPVANENSLTNVEKLERCIWSYKNVVNTLNAVAKEATGIPSAESIKVEDVEAISSIDKGENYEKTYTCDYDANHPNRTFVDEKGQTVVLDAAGKKVDLKHTDYTDTLTEDEIGVLANGSYLLASPCVECDSYNARFHVRCMCDGRVGVGFLFDSNGDADIETGGVRAVVYIDV